MAFPVAVQSAIFYVLACTPCLSARSRYRTRKQSRREREERARLDEEEPDLYRQPSPFNVNPYWQEEIMMGPSLPKKGRAGANSKSTSQRKLTSSGKESSLVTRSSLASSDHGTPNDSGIPIAFTALGTSQSSSVSARANGSGSASNAVPPPASPTLVPDDAHSMSMVEASVTNTTSGEGWNYKRYQREDEELWGTEQSRKNKLVDAIVKAGSSAGRLLESRLGKDRAITDEDRANFYTPAIIHPPVNEYHPPVVSSKPAYKDGLHWMLQPPPPAKVMEGKVPVSRSGSVASSIIGSGAGRRSTATGSDVSLTRKMALEARRRRAGSIASTARPVTPSAEEAGTVTGASRTPSQSASKKAPVRGGAQQKSQRRSNMQGRNRSRSGSGSVASSVEAAGWSSDEDDSGLKARWRFPLSADAAMVSEPATKATTTTTASAAPTEPEATHPPTGTKPQTLHSPAQTSMRLKLSTIVSSDAGSTVSSEPSDNNIHTITEKEDNAAAAAGAEKGAVHIGAGAGAGDEDGAKTEHPRSASSSLDSGLALAA